MKKILLACCTLACSITSMAQQYEYKIMTSVESIVPMGIGRSMLVENEGEVDLSRISAERSGGKSKLGKVKRDDARIEDIRETKLLNFFSGTGINFQNVASNDAIVSTKLNELTREGWELAFVSTGVESNAGDNDGNGIYVTRYILKRPTQQD